jgi:hypothetical protein
MITTAYYTITKNPGQQIVSPSVHPQDVNIRNTDSSKEVGIGPSATMGNSTDGFLIPGLGIVKLTVLPGDVLYAYGDTVLVAVMQQKQA